MRHALCIGALASLFAAWPLAVAAGQAQPDAPADWQTAVEEQIRAEEYHFSQQDDDRFGAPNRAHDLRAKISATGLVVTSRTAGEDESAGGFVLDLRLSAWGRKNAMQDVLPARLSARDERVELDRGVLTEWYVNTPAGLEQGFTIPAPPAGKLTPPLILEFALNGGLGAFPSEDGQEVLFKTGGGTPVLRYAALHVEDATGQSVPARIAFHAGSMQIRVEDQDAVYPLAVDPLLTSPAWMAESNQADAWFGFVVATAGDVNGDGYSDAIVGASQYDNGQSDEGAVFAFLGSASGLSTTPNWTAESDQASARMGESASTAGDVNGDGYADVIVGAAQYDNGENDEGRAYLYMGSATGLQATAAWTAEGNQISVYFGSGVGTAGDVNGDGYSDLIVGARNYTNGQSGEGRVSLYHGAPGGPGSSPDWTKEPDVASAFFGKSVASAGDVNGDGYGDVVIGAFAYANGQVNEGRAFVFHGSTTGLATTAAWTAEGNQSSAFFSDSVGPAGDVNGDGYADVIVGSDGYDNDQSNEGRAFVYHGSAAGLALLPVWSAEGNQGSANFGTSVATAGDVNGDGYSDVIVGANLFDNGQANEGAAFVYHGSAAGLPTVPNLTLESGQVQAQFALSVATAGDVNGDGYSDVIVGSVFFDNGQSNEGRAFVYYGAATGLATGSAWTAESDQESAFFGVSVATAGDVNGDGYSDIVVGAYAYDNGQTDEGRVFAYHGSAGGLAPSPAWSAESNQATAAFGYSVATAGDVNGDGYADVIVGAYLYDNPQNAEGRAFVYHGSPTGLATNFAWTAESDQAGAGLGSSVAPAGDVNGDGYADVIVGAYLCDNGQSDEGCAFAYHGSAAGLSTSPAWTGESDQALARFGLSVAPAGDVNGDGYSDVIAGARLFDNGQSDEGRAFVYHGSAAGLATSPTWTAESDQAISFFGCSVGTAGDVNGDGYADVVVGAFDYDNGQTNEGRAFVYHGSAAGLATAPSWTAESDQGGANLGLWVATAGDVNGDGYADVIVGAWLYDNGQTDEGRAFAYHGSAAGLAASSAWTAEGDLASAWFGSPVAAAGDVNGDGYADVIVGASGYNGSQTDDGRAFVYYGNGGDGLDRLPRQVRADGTVLIAPLGKSDSDTSFRLRALGRTAAGRGKVRLEWERKLLGESFDGTGLARQGSTADTGSPAFPGSAVGLDALLTGVPADSVHHWRLRIRSDSPFFPHSPWLTLTHNGPNEADLRTTGTVAPQVIDVTPPDNAEGVAAGTNVVVKFSEDILASTITPSTFRLLQGATPIAATRALSPSRRLAVLDPTPTLSAGVLYTVEITSGVQDLAGHAALPFTSSFRVAADPPEDGQPLPDASDTAQSPAGVGTAPLVGAAVAGGGDLDLDGFSDFVAGAPGATAGTAFAPAVEAGAAVIYWGSSNPAERVTPDVIFTGAAAHDRAGVSVASDFDFNGDGYNDILIGAEQVNRTDPNPANHVATGPGKAYLIYFDPTDTTLYPNLANPAIPDVLDLGQVGTTIPGVVFVGANSGDQVGFSVAAGGLLDVGQSPDLLIGAPGVDDGMLVNAGAAYGVFNGPLTSPVNLGTVACTHKLIGPCAPAAEVPGVIYQGDLNGMQAGFSVAFVGPLVDDPPVAAVGNAAVGAPTANFGAPLSALGGLGAGGLILVEAGDEDTSIIGVCSVGVTEPGAQIRGHQPGMHLAWSVADGGDTLADGRPDVLIGAPKYDAAAGPDAGEVIHLSAVLQSGIYMASAVGSTIGGVRWDGASAGDELGYAVAGLGDVTGDGFDDVALGAPLADPQGVVDAGAVYVMDGVLPASPLGGVVAVGATTTAGQVFVGTQTGEHAGSSIAAAGDVDGGGFNDFLVGAPDVDASTGTVYIVLPDDADNDGRVDTLDCNTASAQVWDVPAEVPGIALTHNQSSGITTLTWTVPLEKGGLAALSYDTVRSTNPANFVTGSVCVETNGGNTTTMDLFGAPPGVAVYYLVVAQNSCGVGSAGTDSSGDPLSVRSCP